MKARAFTGTLLLIALALSANLAYPQVPQGFSYQAVIRDGNGSPIANKTIGMRITLESVSGTTYYTETQTPSTSEQGVISVTIGGGTQVGGNTFASIPWKSGDVYVKIEIDPNGGNAYSIVGTHTQLQSVPYALYAENTKEVVSPPNATDEEPIFVVRNKAGKIVFAVYQAGVRVYVEDTQVKGTKGGFAVGGLSGQNKGDVEYLRITPDSARIFINETPSIKGTKGGFAVGGLSGVSKTTTRDLMFVALDSTRIYIDSSKTVKGTKGGFAVGGLSGVSKGSGYDLLKVTADSTRIYVDENPTKGTKGGFAVGGLSGLNKTTSAKYLDLTPKNYFIGHESGKATTSGEFNSFLGYQAGIANTTGSSNSLMGYQAGYGNTEGSGNLLLGYQSGYSNTTGNYNSFLGYLAGNKNTSGIENTFVGSFAGNNNLSGSNNTFLGFNTGLNNSTGGSNSFVGTNSGYSNTVGNHNVFIGTESGYSNTVGNYNSFIGYHTGHSNVKGRFNVFMGYESGFSTDSSYNTLIGYQAGRNNTTGNTNVFIGYKVGYENTSGSNNVFIGNLCGNLNNATRNTFIGNYAGYNNISGEANVAIGEHAGYNSNTSGNVYIGVDAGSGNISGNSNVYIGYLSGQSNTEGFGNIAVGTWAHQLGTGGNNNVFMGTYAGWQSYGTDNVYLGPRAGQMITGNNNIAIGSNCAAASGFDASDNIFIGRRVNQWYAAGAGNVIIGSLAGQYNSGAGNTLLGQEAGWNVNAGSNNVIIGNRAGYNGTGNYNVFIGYQAGYNETGSNKLFISNRITDASSSLIYGEFDNKILNFNAKVGIGTTSPSNKLQIGPILTGGTATSLVSSISMGSDFGNNAIGTNFKLKLFETTTPSYSYGLGISSNLMEIVAGTTGSIGFFTNGANERMRLDATGNLGVGVNNPDEKLVVYNGSTTGKYTTTGWTHSSDIRLKENITNISNVLPSIVKLQGVKFNFISDISKTEQIGFVAQDFERVFPEFVITDKDGYKSIAYGQINAVLVEAIKEQQKLIDDQKSTIESLSSKQTKAEQEMESLKSELKSLREMITQFKK